MKNFLTCSKLSTVILYKYIISSLKVSIHGYGFTRSQTVSNNEKLAQSSQMLQHITVLWKDRMLCL